MNQTYKLRYVISRDLQNPGISMMNPLGKLRKRPLFDAPTSQILDSRVFTRKLGFRSWDRQNHVFSLIFSEIVRITRSASAKNVWGGGSVESMYVASPKGQDDVREPPTSHFDAKLASREHILRAFPCQFQTKRSFRDILTSEGPRRCAGPCHEPFRRKTATLGTHFESIHKPIPNKTVVP